MSNDRSAPAADAGWRWSRFWFTPTDATTLHRLRVCGGLLILAWMLSFAGHQDALLSLGGWFDRDAYIEADRMQARARANEGAPPPVPIGWSIFYLAGANRALFDALYWGAMFVTLLFTLGLGTRITGILTWVAVVSFLANPATSYDADFLLGILAFYLMIAYLLIGLLNGRLTPLEYALGPNNAFVLSRWFGGEQKRRPVSYAANFALRLLQIHFAIIVVTSGLHKLQIADWWAGVALWYPMHPPFQVTAQTLDRERAAAPLLLGLLSFVQYLALAWQIGFPMFAWRRGGWRVVLLGGAMLGWAGSWLIMDQPWFGPFYLVCCLSYLHADEWQRARGLLGRMFGARETPARISAAHKVAV